MNSDRLPRGTDEGWFLDRLIELSERWGTEPQPNAVHPEAGHYSVRTFINGFLRKTDRSARLDEILYKAWLAQSSQDRREAFSRDQVLASATASYYTMAELLVDATIAEYVREAYRHGVTLLGSVMAQGQPRPGELDYYLILSPDPEPFAAIEAFHGHFGQDEVIPHDMPGFLAFLGEIYRETPFTVTRCDRHLRLLFVEPVPEPERLIDRLADYNSDLISQSDDGFEVQVEHLRRSGEITMWWD